MANTFINISTITVGSGGAASIDFTSIPATYTDLKLVYSVRGETGTTNADVSISFNGSTANFSNRYIQANGATAASYTTPARNAGVVPANTSTANTFGSTEIYIPNYASANYKSYSIDSTEEENNATSYMQLYAGLWSDTSAITQVTLTFSTGDAAQYSTATLYGIKSS